MQGLVVEWNTSFCDACGPQDIQIPLGHVVTDTSIRSSVAMIVSLTSTGVGRLQCSKGRNVNDKSHHIRVQKYRENT